jgi:hypothetical protein
MKEAADSKPANRRRGRKFLLISLAVLVTGLLIYYFICGLAYREGSRSGILIKVSKKGYVFKTYEGEMNIGGFDQGAGTILPSSIFKFSAADRKTYEKLETLQGKKIVVHYKQVIKNFFWQGDTEYFVQDASLYQ